MFIENLYWNFTRFFYKYLFKVDLGKRSKLVMHGSVKGGANIHIGDDFFIGKDFLLATYKDDEKDQPYLQIGNNVSAQRSVRISCMNSVIIEDNVLMASTILITDNNHGTNPSDKLPYKKQKNQKKAVFIGEGAWIGEQCVILAGSYIGKRSVIGANSVVTGVIDDYSMAVGNPARVIKKWNFQKNEWVRVE